MLPRAGAPAPAPVCARECADAGARPAHQHVIRQWQEGLLQLGYHHHLRRAQRGLPYRGGGGTRGSRGGSRNAERAVQLASSGASSHDQVGTQSSACCQHALRVRRAWQWQLDKRGGGALARHRWRSGGVRFCQRARGGRKGVPRAPHLEVVEVQRRVKGEEAHHRALVARQPGDGPGRVRRCEYMRLVGGQSHRGAQRRPKRCLAAARSQGAGG